MTKLAQMAKGEGRRASARAEGVGAGVGVVGVVGVGVGGVRRAIGESGGGGGWRLGVSAIRRCGMRVAIGNGRSRAVRCGMA